MILFDRIEQVNMQIGRAWAAIVGDFQASPSLAEAVQALYLKSQQMIETVSTTDQQQILKALDELENVGQEAQEVAQADLQTMNNTKKAIYDACESIKRIKHEANLSS